MRCENLRPEVDNLSLRWKIEWKVKKKGKEREKNSNDSASPWNIPYWIFTSAKHLLPAVILTLQFSMFFSR